MGPKGTPQPAKGATDWSKAEERLEKVSSDLTKERLSGKPSQAVQQQLDKLGLKLPSLAKASATPLGRDDLALRELQSRDGLRGLEARARCNSRLSQLEQAHRNVLADRETPPETKQAVFDQIREAKVGAREAYQKDIAASPEGFLAAHVADMRSLRRDYDRGRIVKVPYVREKITEMAQLLAKGQVVFVSGETGIGKTEVARIASKAFSGQDPLVVRGYAGMSADELFGHMALTTDREQHLKTIKQDFDAALKSFREVVKSPTKEQEAELLQTVLAKSGSTISTYVLGAIYKAAQEGRIVIIDEANYIPPELIASLNDILTKRPGEKVNVQQDGIPPIEVKEGFGIIFTGNVNPPSGPLAKRYIGRHQFDLAFQDRISMVPYSYLPQAVEGNPKDFSPEQKQLFMVALTTALIPPPRASQGDTLEKLESRYGTCFLPGGEKGIDTLWRLSKFAAVTQRAFAGEVRDGDAHGFSVNGTSVGHQPSVSLSPRAFMRVIESWRDDGFQVELDHYIAKDLLQRALDPKDKAYLYQLARFFGFFDGPGWDKKPDYEAAPMRGVFSFAVPTNRSERAEIVPARKAIEAIYGEAPGRTEWPDGRVAEVVATQNHTAQLVSQGAAFDALLGEIDQLIGAPSKK
jgi:MoxR-like ATPase